MADYMASLALIKSRNFATLWPTHGPPVTEPGPFIDAYVEHRHDRTRQILAQLAGGETQIEAMVPRMYVGVDERLYPAAARSVLAHMIDLVRTGRVRTDGAPALKSDYRLA
jgi:glyoxylase-like metal-dependent hydrolase (beta-lactamase superfamily II)